MIDPPKRTGHRLTYDAECMYNDWQEVGGCTCFLGNAPCTSCCHEGHPISLEENDEAWELNEEEIEMSRSEITDKGGTINRDDFFSKEMTDYLSVSKSGNNATTNVGDVNMSVQRKSVKVELFDNDQGLPVEYSLVGSWVNYVTEDSDGITVQEIISTGEVADLLKQHNEVRVDLIDEEILTRTGNSVNLRPIKLKNLTWLVDGRKVN